MRFALRYELASGGPAPRSCGFFGIERQFEPVDLVAQRESAFLQPAHHEFIQRRLLTRAIDQGIQVGVLHAQFDQAPLWGMQV